MKDIGEAKKFLGLDIIRDRPNKTIYLSQRQYITDILQRFRMQDCNPVATPFDNNVKLHTDMTPANDKNKHIDYQAAVGALQYAATCTRPDIAFAVSVVSRFSSNPCKEHYEAVTRILKYIAGTINYRLKLCPTDMTITGYTDADWASGNQDNRKSTSGYSFHMGRALISWRSCKQPTVALSTMEAEYVALSEAAREALFLQNLFHCIGIQHNQPITIYCDNAPAIAVAKNPVDGKRLKHIDIKYNHVRDHVHRKHITVTQVESKFNTADIFTKGLPKSDHDRHVESLGLINLQT